MISTLSIALVGCGDTCEITVDSKTGGYVTGYGVYKRGEEVTIKAIPYTGYEFDYWTISPYYGNGIYPRKETKNPYSFRIHSDETEINVTPHFKTQGSSGSSSGSSSTIPQYAVIEAVQISLRLNAYSLNSNNISIILSLSIYQH